MVAMIEAMPTVTISTLRQKTRAVLKWAEQHPILVTRYGKPAFLLMSAAHYEQLTAMAGTE